MLKLLSKFRFPEQKLHFLSGQKSMHFDSKAYTLYLRRFLFAKLLRFATLFVRQKTLI